MTTKEFDSLSDGDKIKHKMFSGVWTVMANYGDRVTLVRTADATNADEWELVSKVKYTSPKE